MTDEELADWLAQRAGKLTASRMGDAMAFLKNGKEAEARARLKMDLVAERMTGESVRHFVNDAMKWGLEQEPQAKAEFELRTGLLLTSCGFYDHPAIEYFGATPDGLLPDAVAEFKCPTTTTHLRWILDGGVPEQHKPQILAQMACTGRRKAYFASYDPRIRREESRMFWTVWEPDESEIHRIEEAASVFLAEVDELFQRVIRS